MLRCKRTVLSPSILTSLGFYISPIYSSAPNCPGQITSTQFPRKTKHLGQEENCDLEHREIKSRKEKTLCNFLVPSCNFHSHTVFLFISADHSLANTSTTLKAVPVQRSHALNLIAIYTQFKDILHRHTSLKGHYNKLELQQNYLWTHSVNV